MRRARDDDDASRIFSLSLSLSLSLSVFSDRAVEFETQRNGKQKTICVVREFGAQLSARIAREERVRVRARRRRW